MRAYINAQNPKTISGVIHHSILAHKIFSYKKEKKAAEKGGKSWEKSDKNEKSGNGKKAPDAKKKDKGPCKGPNKLTPEQMESYRKENKCFRCGESGHTYHMCPTKKKKGRSHGLKRGSQRSSRR